jgi:hypothetical protein
MPEQPSLITKIVSLFAIIAAISFGVAFRCLPEALILCGLILVHRSLNAVQMEIFALRQAIGDQRALRSSEGGDRRQK